LTDSCNKFIIFLMDIEKIDSIIKAAIKEDMPQGDITSENIIPLDSDSEAVLIAQEKGVLAGIDVAERVFKIIDPFVSFENFFKDGQVVERGDKLAELLGNSISLLKGERIALNFLQRMSGIASLTRKFVKALEGSKTKVLDTRKTTPGLRILEKYAVKVGGGENHRFSLSDMALIKDNHLRLVGSIPKAIKLAKEKVKPGTKIEVETNNFDEVKEAVQSGADMIMLDNMSLEGMGEVVRWIKGRVPLEASGNIDLIKAKKIASIGIDYVSVGVLTHSFKSLNINMEFL